VLAVLVSLLLVGGVTWHSLSANADATVAAQAASTTGAALTLDQGSSAVLAGGRTSYADIVKRVAPSVVTIQVQSRARVSPTVMQDDDLFRRFFGAPSDESNGPRRGPAPSRQGLGSGVIVSSDGYILTNHHVVDGAEQMRVSLTDGRSFEARAIGSDQASDLALIKIDAANLAPLTLGDSDAVEVGDVVLAIGNPLNVGQTVTMGIISAKGRATGVGDGSYEDFLQTDAPINQGNSGGALVSMKGEVVGINSQILSPSGGNIGIGFSIPANMARHVMEELRTEGRVRRAQLGVTIQPVTSDLAQALSLSEVRGAIVSEVAPDSAASRAGIERRDVIVSFNGQPVSDGNALRNRVSSATPGTSATVGVIRDGRERTLTVTLDELSPARTARNAAPGRSTEHAALGVSVEPLTPELRSRQNLPDGLAGLVVRDVDPEGRAADAGLQPGDVIEEVNRTPVRTVDDLRAAVQDHSDRPVLMLLNRDGRSLFLTVRPS
jgi:Do/DeqQ family serine protease